MENHELSWEICSMRITNWARKSLELTFWWISIGSSANFLRITNWAEKSVAFTKLKSFIGINKFSSLRENHKLTFDESTVLQCYPLHWTSPTTSEIRSCRTALSISHWSMNHLSCWSGEKIHYLYKEEEKYSHNIFSFNYCRGQRNLMVKTPWWYLIP